MTMRRMIDVDITDRDDGKVPVWDSAEGTHIYDDPAGAVAPTWSDWTPTVTQSGAVAATVNYAKYMVVGDITFFCLRLTMTAAGTGNNPIVIGGQPTDLQSVSPGTDDIVGQGIVLDSGTQHYNVLAFANSATGWRMYRDGTAFATVGQNPNFALASGDRISLTGFVRTA
jgi:hypothetical protein